MKRKVSGSNPVRVQIFSPMKVQLLKQPKGLTANLRKHLGGKYKKTDYLYPSQLKDVSKKSRSSIDKNRLEEIDNAVVNQEIDSKMLMMKMMILTKKLISKF